MRYILNRISFFSSLTFLVVFLAGCGNNSGNASVEDASHGTIRISVDESFRPVIDSQIKVFQASYPEAHIEATYKTEADCLKDLSDDSIRMVIVTRGLSEAETKSFEQKLSFKPSYGLLAFDGIAVLVNKNAKDSLFSIDELKDLLSGESAKDYKIVMDGVNATSTVRYAIDSILRGKPISPKVQAAKSSPEVIDYVAKDPKAIGLIGVSWVGNQDDSTQLSFLSKVKIASMQCDACPGEPYTKPYQANLALGRYPMRRGLYYILKENYPGLGNGLVSFMTFERGQLIFKRAYLLPARMSFEVREAKITE